MLPKAKAITIAHAPVHRWSYNHSRQRMSDNIFYNIFSDNGSFMLGLSLGAIICVALIVIGVVRFTAAKGTNGGFSAMLFMAAAY